MDRVPLTRQAHEALLPHLQPGGLAVDATAGNGHDTLFLARALGPHGRVHAFDVQAEALENTHRRLQAAGVERRVVLHLSGHERLLEKLPSEGCACAVLFNLGYLPGGDKRLTTHAETTLTALEQALRALAPDGLLSVLAYRGHPGGRAEAEAVAGFLKARRDLALEVRSSPGPVLFLARRAR